MASREETILEKTIREETVDLAKALIQRPSVTPNDAGCQDLIAARLKKLGFRCVSLPVNEVQNLWAVIGNKAPLFAFAGHTDVVPAGHAKAWETDPFQPVIKEGFLYGRGASDMKGSIAAMITAIERFLHQYPHPSFKGSLAIMLTSDEEGPAQDGTKKIVEYLTEQGIELNYCLVGEPSSLQFLGDMLKVGRRGSMSGKLIVYGLQGHIAYPDRCINPIHLVMKPLLALTSKVWDNGNAYFSPTTFQISNLNSGTGAGNVVPGILECAFNFRFSTEQTPEKLQAEVHQILDNAELRYDLQWDVSGHPFLTKPGPLLQACQQSLKTILNREPELSTTGGTSDARFIAPLGTEVIEFGPLNATIHQANENIEIEVLSQLSRVYESILRGLFQCD